MPSTIRLERVTKTYRQGTIAVRALDGVDLEISAGDFVTVMGPSGSGKTTLLHLIGGLDVPTSGEVYLDGEPLSRLSARNLTLMRRRHIGIVFQLFHLLPMLTVFENVAMPLLLDGKRIREVAPRVDELIALCGLGGRRAHRPDQLSGGEIQRVAIARALVADPMVVLADEPTGSLDRATGASIMEALVAVTTRLGTTVVVVTHDASVASYGTRAISVRDGRIVDDVRAGHAAGRPGSSIG